MTKVAIDIDGTRYCWAFPGTLNELGRAVKRGALPLELFSVWQGRPPARKGEVTPSTESFDDEVLLVHVGGVWSATAYLGDDVVSWTATDEELGQVQSEGELASIPPHAPLQAWLDKVATTCPRDAETLLFVIDESGETVFAVVTEDDEPVYRSDKAGPLPVSLAGLELEAWAEQAAAALAGSLVGEHVGRFLAGRRELAIEVTPEDQEDMEWSGTLTPSGLS